MAITGQRLRFWIPNRLEIALSRMRAAASALVLFLGMSGTMAPLGAMVFEETATLTLYGAGVTAGAGWLSWSTYRASRNTGRDRAQS
jgi:hypothetical protein